MSNDNNVSKDTLKEIWKLTATIKCVSGLAIKDSGNSLEIGGIDSEVIKNPVTNLPYIPGSSIKGKMRCMLERAYGSKDKYGNIQDTHKQDKNNQDKNKQNKNMVTPCQCGKEDCLICNLFGAHMNTKNKSYPVRIIVRDATLTEEYEEKFKTESSVKKSFLEIKTENIINRSTGNVAGTGARTIERVAAGTEFDLEIMLQIYEKDKGKEEKYKKAIQQGLELLELSYLGGSGSRGYGQIQIINDKWDSVYNVASNKLGE